MKKIEYFKVVLILPFNVVITIPLLVFLFTRNSFTYDLINIKQPFFYISIFLLGLGLWLSIWSVRLQYQWNSIDLTPPLPTDLAH